MPHFETHAADAAAEKAFFDQLSGWDDCRGTGRAAHMGNGQGNIVGMITPAEDGE